MSYMCVVVVEMVCLPDFFNCVSVKEHIAATFSLGALAKDCLATCVNCTKLTCNKVTCKTSPTNFTCSLVGVAKRTLDF